MSQLPQDRSRASQQHASLREPGREKCFRLVKHPEGGPTRAIRVVDTAPAAPPLRRFHGEDSDIDSGSVVTAVEFSRAERARA